MGLLRASVRGEHALKGILEADSYSEGSVFLHVLGEGFILTLFRSSEFISPTPVEQRMFQLVMQDEARHVSYGLQHLKYLMDNCPDVRPQINSFLDEAELGLGPPEELDVLRVGPRPAALDEVHPEVVQLVGDDEFVVDGRRDALDLEAVSQGGVEDLDGLVHVGSLLRWWASSVATLVATVRGNKKAARRRQDEHAGCACSTK